MSETQNIADGIAIKAQEFAADNFPPCVGHIWGEGLRKKNQTNAEHYRSINAARMAEGELTYDAVLIEGAFHAAAQHEPSLRVEALRNLAAVIVAEIAALDALDTEPEDVAEVEE